VDSAPGSGDFASGTFDALLCKDREVAPGEMPGLVRLTHRQYDNAITDLLGLRAGAETDFVDDQEFFGFDNNAQNLSVPANQVLRYRATAERIAQEAAADLSAVKRAVPCVAAGANAACRDSFVSEFLKLLFRRPLSDAERTRYRALFDEGNDLYAEGEAFARGVRIVLEAALQSPAFTYRAELRDTPLDGRVLPLDGHELAARLSLTLWASVPDAALMRKADANQLASEAQVEAEARRMLEDPKAARVLDDFHAQWLELGKLRFDKDPATFPDFDKASFETSARQEMLQFSRHVAQQGESIGALFTAPYTFVDAQLAELYGVSAPQSGFARVELDPTERAGLFTQVGFLAGHADALDSSPIHRGAYIQKRVLCTTFGALPADVGMLPPRGGELVTTRDRVEAKTEPPQCQFCHGRINPAGFAFEAFDTLGQHRTRDHGEQVDASGTLRLDGKDVSFDGAVQFARALAESESARRCYETQWFRYGLGRGEADDDLCLLDEIDARTQREGGSVKELLVSLTLSRAFRFRAQEDL
jgi:Protein of unknown function (DUF1592)/Protein of unknown function (DUF1588)/Protein of unknown function (DUF1587)/Protein of unknown function (DUF1585)/Protein of unknown function (DUF1595)